MSSLSKSSGMGFLLDSAVKNAVSHLASSDPHPLQAHEVHQVSLSSISFSQGFALWLMFGRRIEITAIWQGLEHFPLRHM